jgi:ubiquitin C-terminal hydrolase
MRENVRHPTKVEVNLWNNWINILKIIQSGNSNEMIHPNGFIRSIIQVTEHKKGFSFSENEPGDANEFILFMIETLHMCVCHDIDITIAGHAENGIDNLAIEVYKHMKSELETNYSNIEMMFRGTRISCISSVHSPYQQHSQLPETFKILDLPIVNESPSTIYHSLSSYTQAELLDGNNQWYNEKTNQYEDVRKHTYIWSFPEILIISLNRNQPDGTKNDTYVQYPMVLDLQSYTHGYKKTDNIYDLVGVCVHLCQSPHGHITAFVKKDNNWYFCNDEVIQIIEKEEHLQTKYAHCLFYTKKNSE